MNHINAFSLDFSFTVYILQLKAKLSWDECAVNVWSFRDFNAFAVMQLACMKYMMLRGTNREQDNLSLRKPSSLVLYVNIKYAMEL
jgi:hypothetical protein